ncbi:PAS domain-containing protein [Ramlibacter ginsenosidimutans]|uniref:histidine kinase n=1 Tax=Ramlibacter ginsenosidimutans TaxID=502333 RepID=A0A934TWD2_9BURK|nr:PAS domain-containing protein [Ramlibacter ginsenosidimutans]MBK6008140.1 PAS domain-containing protein [Ramlibacter ginsenosidimutans]
MRRAWRDLGAVLAVALLTGALLVFALLYLREAELRSGEELADSLSRVISEQTARTLQSVDQALQLSIVRVESLRQAGKLDETTGPAALREGLQDLQLLRALWIVDRSGRILMDSDPGNVGKDMSDRPYVQAYVRAPQTNFFISPILRSRTTGTWMMSVARPIRDADGSVREVIAGAVEPAYFERLWRGIDLGPSGAVVLYSRDGQLLARSPANEAMLGKDFSSAPIFRDYLPRSPHGTFIRESDIDGVTRMVAYRQLETYPDLVVAVGSSYDEMLAPWRRFAILTAAVWTAAVLVALALTVQLRRQARRSEQTEVRFQQLAQAMPQIVFVAGVTGRVQFINHRWVELTGLDTQEALGTGWRQLVHPADLPAMMKRLRKALSRQREVQFEHRLRYRDGSYRWQLLRAVPVRGPDESLVSWFGTATDIDALKQAEDRLRAQAEQLYMAGRLTRMGHWRADLETERVSLSAEAASLMELPPDSEPTLQEFFATLAPASVDQAVHVLDACVRRGEPFDTELELKSACGRQVWLRSVGEPVRDATGKVVGIQGAQQDITLRVLMMEEIRRLNATLEERIAERTAQLSRQDALFRTLAEQAPLPFWTVDPKGNVTFLSRAWYELAGGAPPKWEGGEWLSLVHPDDQDAVRQNWRRSAAAGEPYTGTRRLRARDGTYHTTSYRAVPVRDEQGQVLLWVGTDTDITDLMANQEALRLANRQLEAFSYSVSHDLQSPLQRVGSYARLLRDELAPVPEGRAHHYLARIQANADEMAQLIEGLLALAHVSELEIIRTPLNLSDMATEILQRLQAENAQRQVQWRVDPGLAAVGDVRLVRSVLENLIGNAWKFSARSPVADLHVGASSEPGVFYVQDNGAGFDMAYADRLFGTFQRLHSPDEFPGTGIGLATVARAVSRHGGRVWARSAPAEGATFFFTLPQA